MSDTKDMKRKISQISWTEITKEPDKISIELLWRIYSGHIFTGKEVGSVQYSETKQAFYVGFSECFKFMTDIASGLEEDHACKVFSNLANEMNKFTDSLIERKIHG